MQFGLKSLWLAVSVACVATYLFVVAPSSAATAIAIVFSGAVFFALGRKRFRTTANLAGIGTLLLFCYLASDGLLISLRPVVARAANHADAIREEYFCIQAMPGMKTRNVLIAEGTFDKQTWLSATLYAVQAGDVQELNGGVVGRSPHRIGEPQWIEMRLTLALADAPQSSGRVTQIGFVGQTRGGGSGGGAFVHDIPIASQSVYQGPLNRGQMRIVYVEGEAPVTVTSKMSVREFANINHGRYLVVVAGLLP